MLGKLIKYEWKNSWLIMTILNSFVIVLSILGGFTVRNLERIGQFEGIADGMIIGMYMFVYFVGIVSLTVVSSLYFYIRFYRNLYTDQGYLMHTLPVTKHELITSKLLIAGAWKIISYLVIAIGMLYIFNNEGFELFREIKKWIENLDEDPLRVVGYIVLSVLIGIAYVMYSILTVYAAISIGQLASKNKVWGAIGAYVGLRIVIRFLGRIVGVILMMIDKDNYSGFTLGILSPFLSYSYGMSNKPNVMLFMFLYLIGLSFMCAIFYIITHYMMKNRLNLE